MIVNLLEKGNNIIDGFADKKALLVFLFYKAISDRYLAELENIEKEKPNLKDIKKYLIANVRTLNLYDVDNKKLLIWHNVKNSPNEFINALNKILELNKNTLAKLRKLMENTNFYSLFEGENKIILEKLINLFSKADFSKLDYNTLEDTYKWILQQFTSEKQVYTPREVSKLLAYLIEPQDEEVILDPACSFASTLREIYMYAKNKDKNANIVLVGQEQNEIASLLAELNFILSKMKNAKVFTGDFSVYPKFKEEIKKFYKDGKADKVVANLINLNPNKIKTINHYARKMGAIVIDNNSLSNEEKDKNIRENFVKNDIIDAVILLPQKTLNNCKIIVLNKEKKDKRKGKILFINASKFNSLSEKNIKKIAKIYKEFKEEKGISKIVDIKNIEKNKFNLDVSLYTPSKNKIFRKL